MALTISGGAIAPIWSADLKTARSKNCRTRITTTAARHGSAIRNLFTATARNFNLSLPTEKQQQVRHETRLKDFGVRTAAATNDAVCLVQTDGFTCSIEHEPDRAINVSVSPDTAD